jgi:hypothetical protein
MPSAIRAALFLAVALCIVAGCSGPPRAKVKGKLVDGGEPVRPDPNRSMTLIFTPDPRPEEMTSFVGLIANDQGEFTLDGPDFAGIPLGKYKVKLQVTDPSPSQRMRALDKRFGNDNSPIIVEVTDKPGPLVIDIAQYKGK